MQVPTSIWVAVFRVSIVRRHSACTVLRVAKVVERAEFAKSEWRWQLTSYEQPTTAVLQASNIWRHCKKFEILKTQTKLSGLLQQPVRHWCSTPAYISHLDSATAATATKSPHITNTHTQTVSKAAFKIATHYQVSPTPPSGGQILEVVAYPLRYSRRICQTLVTPCKHLIADFS